MASAADLRVVTKAPPPLPPPVQDWSGFYVGLEGGYGWGHEDTNGVFPWNADPVALEKNETCTELGTGHCSGAPGEADLAFILLGISPGLPNTGIGSHSTSGWLAGGGAKAGLAYGRTDDFGYEAVENPMHVHDLHATILHLLGLDHQRLTYRYAGRDMRLTYVHGEVIREVLA